jgi:orotidine-5'-phosphate decarboxylase
MDSAHLLQAVYARKSFLCVGIDTDVTKLPPTLGTGPEALLRFNKEIIAATAPYAVAYKFNLAFYECMGPVGWELLQQSLALVPKDCLTIADAKRDDIGNTALMYAQAFFEQMDFDAITVAPYMGKDSVLPFLEYVDKWVFLLARTSNPGADDFQLSTDASGEPLYQRVVRQSMAWTPQMGTLGFVAGATRPQDLQAIRAIAPQSWLLVPGVGAQGGDLHTVCQAGLRPDAGGLLINSSRSILYASSGTDFAEKAAHEALALQQTMSAYIHAKRS